MLTLASGMCGVLGVAGGLERSERWLLESVLLAVLAIRFLAAARCAGNRFGWLLSGSVAAGLAIAATCNLIGATTTPALPVAGVVIFIAAMLLFARAVTRQPPCQ
jgi:hypothetical protein